MTDADFEARMGREHAAFLERVRTGDLRTVVATLREWSEVESVPAQDEFDLILARLEALASACPRPKATPASACEWCGRAIEQDAEGRWYAVKGKERGYDPLACEASEDGRHAACQPTTHDCGERSPFVIGANRVPCEREPGHEGRHRWAGKWGDRPRGSVTRTTVDWETER